MDMITQDDRKKYPDSRLRAAAASSIKITSDRYGHLLKHDGERPVDRMGQLIKGKFGRVKDAKKAAK